MSDKEKKEFLYRVDRYFLNTIFGYFSFLIFVDKNLGTKSFPPLQPTFIILVVALFIVLKTTS